MWASSIIRKRPGQIFEVQTIGEPPEYCMDVIRPGDPHRGQARTATKLGLKHSLRWAKSSKNTISLGAISESDDRFDICRIVGGRSERPEPGTSRAASRTGRALAFRGLLLCFAT
jgi:hypothetical protein